MYTRETQKLMHWLMADFSNFENGNEVGASPTEYQLYKTKKILKKEYLKLFKYDLVKDPLTSFLKLLEDKDNKSIDELQESFVKAVQSVYLQDEDFSVALKLMSQEKANKFVSYLYELAIDMGIPLRSEIASLFAEQQNEVYNYICLKKKVCAICGRTGELEHFDNVARVGGYKFDDGRQLRFMCLCREHHSEAHNIGKINFSKKYHIAGIYLKDKQIKELKKVYKNHFKAFKEVDNVGQ